MVCGDGVRGCHGEIEAHNHGTILLLVAHILSHRPDTIAYLRDLMGDTAMVSWFEHQMS
jgi:hypothetical protein